MSPEAHRLGQRTPPAGGLDQLDEDSFNWTQGRHFLHAPLRRPWLVLTLWAAVVVLSAAALFGLPRKYVSSTLILVESEKVPESFIPKVATEDRSRRLEAVRPEILSRTRLERVLEDTQPYPDIASKTLAVEKMRKAISINVSSNDGFTIAFHHSDARKAQEVTDRLARLFIEETIRSREQQVEGAVDFLITQVEEARTELESKDAALRRYKEEHMGQLPEQLQTNLATMQMLQREVQMVEESLLFAREKQEALARGVGRPSPGAVSGTSATSGFAEVAELNRQLSVLKTRYKDEHPDVQTLRLRIARIEARLAALPAADGPADADPSMVVIRAQIERADLEVRKLEDRQRGLERRIATIRANVEETPRTEQELATLTRDYQKLNENYVALFSKQLEAQMSGRLEQRWKGERFRMLDPASLPEKPAFPKPSIFLGLGVFFGLVVGVAASLLAELVDPTIKDSLGLQAVQGYPVLACIPHHPHIGGPARPRLVRLDAPARHADGIGREVGEKSWAPSGSLEVAFRDEGITAPSKVVPILDSLKDHNSAVGEELRLLAAKLLDLGRRRKVNCLALTSSLPVEGKSTVSVGLAGALAREPGRRILLIEADLRRPSFTANLGLRPAPGLSDWLHGTVSQVPVRLVEPGGFVLLTAGDVGVKRPEMLGSQRMGALLRAARQQFDFVLLDTVPVLPVADAILMQDLVDGFLLVVRSRQTPRHAISDALAKLRSDTVVGVVLNDHKEYRGTYKAYAYRRHAAESRSPASPSVVAMLATDAPATIAAPDPSPTVTFQAEQPRASHGRKPLVALAAATLVVAVAAAGYLAGWDRRQVAPAAAVVQPVSATVSAEAAAPPERVEQLEERLQAIEAEKAAAAAPPAADARRKVEAQTAAWRQRANPIAVARAQEEAGRRPEAEQERRSREEQLRLQAEQRLAEEQLMEERRRNETARALAAAATAPVPATTPVPPPAAPPPPPPPATAVGALVKLDDPGVIAPVLDRAFPPTYPPVALRQRLEGAVQLNVLVDETGNVVVTQIVAGAGGRSGLNEAAVSSVRGRRYRPATKDGVPVKVWMPVRVQFRLP
jgi:polysaccharide chain length determinant protein (PEP-CTERM system associated)